jgi:multiple sugar transport system substrate-binding protein
MKKQLVVLATLFFAATIILTGCGTAGKTAAPVPTSAPATAAPATLALTPITTNATTAAESPTSNGKILIRWSIGIDIGSNPDQVAIENSVVEDFNKSQNKIYLVDEIISNASASEIISTEMAAGVGPDIVGPVGWIGSNAYYGQWLDLAPYIKSTNYETSKFDPAIAASYQTDQGTVGLPFAVFPSAFFYNTGLFKAAGLNPLPSRYGDQYKMPDGSMVAWDWKAVAQIAKLLTIDKAGKNSTQTGFDATNIMQYGFSFGYEGHPNDWATYQANGGALLVSGGSKGSYAAKIPDSWKSAWQWVYDGMWGAQPYIPVDAVSGTNAWGAGNALNSGKVGMTENPSWILCCISDLTKAGGKFEIGTMPIGSDGKVAGRVDEDTFRIWKGTKHPAEAFTVLTYLIDTGIQKLVVGTPKLPPAYLAIPGIAADRAAWLASEQSLFPFVQNWQTLLDGLNYPDVPSAEGYMPNINNAWTRIQTLGYLMGSTKGVDMAAQEGTLESDLTAIFNK